jgi:ribonuclease HII
MNVRFLIGIDEAGRGPLAGPVSIGAVIVRKDFNTKILKGVRDSKKLSEIQREVWFKKLKQWKKEGKLDYSVALVGSTIIDTKGISHAIRKGISRCLKKLEADHRYCSVLLDGSLYAPKKFLNQKTIIGGDDKIKIISLASIAAKVTRDRKMKRLAKIFYKYDFHIHKGYGTKLHRQKILKFGPSEIHRMSFLSGLLNK